MLSIDQFKKIMKSSDYLDEELIDVDDHGWSFMKFIIEIDQFCIDKFEVDKNLLGTFWACEVSTEPEWGIQWETCYTKPYQVEKKEVVKTEWRAVV
ncbi:hypothetical protein LAh9_95 [Aeromonas phage LAh_9]|uniref:Uncharacterized protein n=4 Tax=Lahexavirus TaxID=2843411 RepID=A0A514A102_9CAUD|nr:hypothetical protein HWC29_gp023 [Aeromonas phage 4_4572]YP_009847246.1 hypothetical protein HWC30_gp072 [Aeromonas phage LAh_6]YP_009847453.1 hypothetical protein HWC31_gp115 [Aeromonas phage LAh_8]YP_009847577.1 hypothetical protein HWC32_gp096 [Aeromonas phage LAh_9]QDH46576.1 hypothetical protein LAh6_72 [Aeromonas phage LAh_6]QDH46812.1 hypothetical protein LAh8_114 [Aeromonas phage LAh_8]QDH46953.1 hypothetical protein LAh9_95 [Aeromonas phage LAh_9]QEG09021.1 hypothetical protein [